MGASGPPSSSSGGGGEGKISSRGAGGKGSSIGGGGGGKAPPRVPSVSSPSPRRGGGGKGRSGVGRRKRAVSRRPSTPFPKFPSFHSPNPSAKNSQGSRGAREGNGGAWGLRAGAVQLPLHFGKRTRRQDSCPTFPPPTPRRGLGPVPGALAPSHELRDEVRTSARDRVAAPSPLRGNLSKHPQPRSHCPQRGARPRPAPSPAAYLPGAAAGSRPPGPSVRAGPRRPAEARCPRAGKDSLWALGPPPGRTSSAGRKKPEPRPRPRSRETGGGPPWPGQAAGRGGPGSAAPSRAEGVPACPPRVRLPAPHRGPERARRVPVAAWEAGSADSASRSRAASILAGEGRGAGGGERAGRARRPDHTRSGPERGAGRAGGPTRQETPPGRGPGLAPGPQPPSRSSRPGPRPRPRRSARRGPPLPVHKPLMSFPDLPPSRPDPRCPRSDSPSPLRDMPARSVRCLRGAEAAPLRSTPTQPPPLPAPATCARHLPTPLPAPRPKSSPGIGKTRIKLGSRVDGDGEWAFSLPTPSTQALL